MLVLILGLIIFLGVHSLSIINEPFRNRLLKSMGEGPFKGAFSAASAIGLVLIVVGYGMARSDPTLLYAPPAWSPMACCTTSFCSALSWPGQ